MRIPKQLQSRKLWLAVIAALVAFVNAAFDMGLSTEQVLLIIGPLLGYITVEGAADIKER